MDDRATDDRAMDATGVAAKPDASGDSDDLIESRSRGIVAATLVQHPTYVPEDGRSSRNPGPIAAMRDALPESLRPARIAAAADEAS